MHAITQRLAKIATSVLLIMVVAFGARLAFAYDQVRKIPPSVIGVVPFEQETGNIAYSLVTGRGFSSPFRKETGPTAWLTPVYPLIVAAAFKIFGIFTPGAFFALVLLNILFSTATCLPIFLVGKRVAGSGAAAGAAWLWVLFPNAIMIPFEWIWDTCLTVLLAAVILWATLKLAESRRPRDWIFYGLSWGLALMTNPALGALLPPLWVWAAYRSGKRTPLHLASPLLALGLAILCCVPWTIRNYAVFHRFVPLRSNLPLELYIGNNENYDEKRPVWPPVITKEREILRFFKMGEIPFMDEEKRKALNFMTTHPRMDLILAGKRFVAFWVGIADPVNVFFSTDSALIRTVMICDALAGVGALLGIVVLVLRRSEYAFPLAAFPIFFPLLYYVTHTSVRYRHPIDPVVLFLAAIPFSAPFSFAKRHSKPAAVRSRDLAPVAAAPHDRKARSCSVKTRSPGIMPRP
jgi:4-amino-4-deoxy-L-arabinose transferase-like glycosyltransferase